MKKKKEKQLNWNQSFVLGHLCGMEHDECAHIICQLIAWNPQKTSCFIVQHWFDTIIRRTNKEAHQNQKHTSELQPSSIFYFPNHHECLRLWFKNDSTNKRISKIEGQLLSFETGIGLRERGERWSFLVQIMQTKFILIVEVWSLWYYNKPS